MLLVLLLGHFSHAQNGESSAFGSNMYISPAITIGYTVGSGLNYGFEVNMGIFDIPNDLMDVTFGISIEYYFVNHEGTVHSIRAFNVMLENQFINARLGSGLVRKKWGIKRINSASAFGLNYGVSISEANMQSPWLGFKQLHIGEDKWEWFPRDYYLAFYMFFKHDPIMIKSSDAPEDGTL